MFPLTDDQNESNQLSRISKAVISHKRQVILVGLKKKASNMVLRAPDMLDNVSILKKMIKDEKAHHLAHLDASDLELYKVSLSAAR